MKRWLALLIACLSLGIVAAGCGDDDDDSGGGSADTAEKATDTGAKTAPSGGGAAGPKVGVIMKNIQFNPKNVTVAKGGTVTWANGESVPHDVTKESGPGPDFSSGKGNLNQGDTYKQTFTVAGKVNYVCTIHPNMTGTVTVK
jgi:plastocyanin